MKSRKEFPSPLGELYFLICLYVLSLFQREFPSPLGELYFLISKDKRSGLVKLRFPSPLGELYFLMAAMTLTGSMSLVSVPSRGAIFLNRKESSTL